MEHPQDNLLELVRHKALCKETKIDLDQISTGLLCVNVLNTKEKALLMEVQRNFQKVNTFEREIDKHLQKYLN